jgi:hypothetical protein
MMGNTFCMAIQAKEAFLAFTRLESTFVHAARELARFSTSLKANALV